ncbi:MAG: hypothetical protein IPO77_07640 [Acidobacteria bacterium]|nr:hypothetical protein [Acidobacteriota bacterium]
MTRKLFLFTLFLILFSAACSKPGPDAVRLAAFDEMYTKMKTCVPESEPQEGIGLAIIRSAPTRMRRSSGLWPMLRRAVGIQSARLQPGAVDG